MPDSDSAYPLTGNFLSAAVTHHLFFAPCLTQVAEIECGKGLYGV